MEKTSILSLARGGKPGDRQMSPFSACQNILIRSANWVGDAVMSLPAIRSVREGFPDARITILAKEWVAPLFTGNPHIDRVMLYETSGRHNGIKGRLRLVKDLRNEKFDLAILLQNAFEAALLARMAHIRNRVGYDTDGRHFLLTHRISAKGKKKVIHQIDYYREILTGAGIAAPHRIPVLTVSEEQKKAAGAILCQYQITENQPLFGINPGAAYGNAKRWMPERFAEVSRKMIRQLGMKGVIFGSRGEKALGEEIASAVGNDVVNLCGKTTLEEALAVISRMRVFITNDSGLMHAAAALGVPLVAIFGSTDDTTTSPVGSPAICLRHPVPCSPCMKPECTKERHMCMEGIETEQVFEAVTRVLSGCTPDEPRAGDKKQDGKEQA